MKVYPKVKVMSHWALSEILLTSAVICKQRFLKRDCTISSKRQVPRC